MNTENIVKIGNVELTESEAWKIYKEKGYIVTYGKIYELSYSPAAQMVGGRVIYTKQTRGGVGFVRRGRFQAMTAKQVNDLIGHKLLWEN